MWEYKVITVSIAGPDPGPTIIAAFSSQNVMGWELKANFNIGTTAYFIFARQVS